jgi:Novel STAND NTPase 1
VQFEGWPEKPYRGLNYLRRADRPLLAGRDEDVAVCTELLAHPETRVLMLHGSTGCGKSSFMRAGLIPGLESEGRGSSFCDGT